MLNRIFSFERLPENQYWFLNLNHLFLFLALPIGFLILLFSLRAKSEKGIIITKFSLGFTMLTLELMRVVYDHLWRQVPEHNRPVMPLASWSFEISAIFTRIAIATLIASCFVSKDNKFLTIAKNFLFGVGIFAGSLMFFVPDNIRPFLPIYHFFHLQTIIQHILMFFVGFYFIKIGELKIHFKNAWMPLFGFMVVLVISFTAANLIGWNFFIVLYDNAFSPILPFDLPHPTQNILIILIGVLILYPLYYFCDKKAEITYDIRATWNVKKIVPYVTAAMALIITLWLPTFMGVDFNEIVPVDRINRRYVPQRAIGSIAALLLLIPFILQVFFMFYWDKKHNKTNSSHTTK